MRQNKRHHMKSRYQRFLLENGVATIVKNDRSRCACFWLNLANVSASGVGLEYRGFGHIPFSIGDVLNLTIDTSSIVFRRPIHLKVVVRRKEEGSVDSENGQLVRVFLGAELLSVDPLHEKVWLEGLVGLGDPYKMDPFGNQKKTA